MTARVFPHYIISGTTHIGPHDKVITEIDFCINDATALFYDFDAFGSVIHSEKFIEEIANGGRDGTRIATGPHPDIFYFTGVYEIARIETTLGKFTVRHAPSYNFPGPWGFHFKNTIVTALEFAEPVTFDIALQRLIDLKRYLGLLIGRPQNITNIVLTVPEEGEEYPHRLDVDWSLLRSVDEVSQYLLSVGADPNSKTVDGITPLHMAAQRGNIAILRVLLRYRANINSLDRNGWTPTDRALRWGKSDAVEFLKILGGVVHPLN